MIAGRLCVSTKVSPACRHAEVAHSNLVSAEAALTGPLKCISTKLTSSTSQISRVNISPLLRSNLKISETRPSGKCSKIGRRYFHLTARINEVGVSDSRLGMWSPKVRVRKRGTYTLSLAWPLAKLDCTFITVVKCWFMLVKKPASSATFARLSALGVKEFLTVPSRFPAFFPPILVGWSRRSYPLWTTSSSISCLSCRAPQPGAEQHRGADAAMSVRVSTTHLACRTWLTSHGRRTTRYGCGNRRPKKLHVNLACARR